MRDKFQTATNPGNQHFSHMPAQQFLKQFLPAVVLGLTFIAYIPCLKADFVNWDDDVHILQNPALKSLSWRDVSEIWTTTVNATYIPMTVTTWAIERHFLGFNPKVFHLDNIVLHLFVTALVIIFSRKLGLSVTSAALAGLIFGIHPIHVEAVAWATSRKDVLYGAFFMLALLSYLKYLDSGHRRYFGLTVCLGLISACAKPMALSLPFALLVLDWMRNRQGMVRITAEKILCGAMLAPVVSVTYFLNSSLVEPVAGQGLLIWSWCFMFYLLKFLFPWPMVLFYGFPQPGQMVNPDYLFSVLLCIVLLAALYFFRRNRFFVFAVFFYIANIFFLLRFQPLLSLVSDRFMYIPSIGLCMFLAFLVEKTFKLLHNRREWTKAFKVALGALMAAVMAVSWRQCEVWHSSVTLWDHQLKHDSKIATWLAYSKLADAYAQIDEQKPFDAFKFNRIFILYQKAAYLKPDFFDPYWGMGRLFESIGDFRSAQKNYRTALRIDPSHFEVILRLKRISSTGDQKT